MKQFYSFTSISYPITSYRKWHPTLFVTDIPRNSVSPTRTPPVKTRLQTQSESFYLTCQVHCHDTDVKQKDKKVLLLGVSSIEKGGTTKVFLYSNSVFLSVSNSRLQSTEVSDTSRRLKKPMVFSFLSQLTPFLINRHW